MVSHWVPMRHCVALFEPSAGACKPCTRYVPPVLSSKGRWGCAGHDSEVFLKPRVIYKDPFRGGDNILVLCDTFEPPRIKEDGSGMTDIVVSLYSQPARATCADGSVYRRMHLNNRVLYGS